ncbi:hypothetical protein [Streptomyces sp. SCUT-3]|uniref:hypothetical protein n=1 Tax=Streptomyces sp. SCUT-3 TaxID=2684469 RepID=UPI0015FE436B|nr:hypothetical protein [Streptomyces sp. SCUT-3]
MSTRPRTRSTWAVPTPSPIEAVIRPASSSSSSARRASARSARASAQRSSITTLVRSAAVCRSSACR